MKKNIIVFYSGGLSSFACADYAKTHFPNANIVLLFTDTKFEDEDLYRFIHEGSDKLELPMLTLSRGLTPPQLMVLQKFMANSRVGTCSKELKMKVASDYLKKGKVPEVETWYNRHFLKDEDFITDATLMFGIDWTEAHREGPISANWKPFTVEFPLIENVIDTHDVLKKYNTEIPKMYIRQFSHNNCAGRCVKAGKSHFRNLILQDEKTFFSFMEQEIVISDYIRYTRQCKGKDYMFDDVWEFVTTGKKSPKIQHIIDTNIYRKKFNFGGRNRPYTFMKDMSLQELEQLPIQRDIFGFDFGGCGCTFA